MAAYADFSYYENTYLGTAIASADFSRLALRASEWIDRLTFQRASDDTDYTDEIKMANCAAAEVLQAHEADGSEDGIQSERVGDHSVTYTQSADKRKSLGQKIREAVELHLGNTGLMYPGFYSGEYSAAVES